jgi:hypothetical protein
MGAQSKDMGDKPTIHLHSEFYKYPFKHGLSCFCITGGNMSFHIIKNGQQTERPMEGQRTLADILSDEEYQQVCQGQRVALTVGGGVMDLSSPLEPGQTVVLALPEDTEIREMFALKYLAMDAPSIQDMESLAQLNELRELSIKNSSVADISSIAKLTQLHSLSIHNCKNLIDLSPLAELNGLRQLEITDCPGIVDIAPILALTQLITLGLSHCTNITNTRLLISLARRGCTVRGRGMFLALF